MNRLHYNLYKNRNGFVTVSESLLKKCFHTNHPLNSVSNKGLVFVKSEKKSIHSPYYAIYPQYTINELLSKHIVLIALIVYCSFFAFLNLVNGIRLDILSTSLFLPCLVSFLFAMYETVIFIKDYNKISAINLDTITKWSNKYQIVGRVKLNKLTDMELADAILKLDGSTLPIELSIDDISRYDVNLQKSFNNLSRKPNIKLI